MLALAHFVTRRPWLVLALWGLLLLVCLPFALQAPGRLSADPGSLTDSESARLSALLADKFAERDLCRGQNGFLLSWTRVFQGMQTANSSTKRSRVPSPKFLIAS